jgi:hypothetical protein
VTAPGENPEAAHQQSDDTARVRLNADDPRKAERLRTPRPDPVLDRIDRHLSLADDELPLADAIRHHRELQERARGAEGAA